eukprot:147951_1
MTALSIINKLIASFDRNVYKKQHSTIEVELHYMKDIGKRFHIEVPSKYNNNIGKYDLCTSMVKHKILNARNLSCKLHSHGFELIHQVTKLSTNDFYKNPNKIIENIYYKEIEQIIKLLTNTEFVETTHHQIRSKGDKPKDVTIRVSKPEHTVHCDYTPHNALNALKIALPNISKKYNNCIDFSKGRYAMINVWRNISDINDIQNDHLAVCDGRSIIYPDDCLKYEVLTRSQKHIEAYYLSDHYQHLHKWYYFPRMNKNELLVFIQYDSDFTVPSRFGFHTAIKDPNISDKCVPRESIEARLIAFFPYHTPNTIPNIK